MGRLRVPFFVLALVVMGLVVLVEVASPLLLGGGSAVGGLLEAATDRGLEVSGISGVEEPPGRAIGYLALVDVIGLYSIGLMAVGLLLPDRLHGRLQGVVTLVGSIVLIVVAVVALIVALVEVLVMVALLTAAPFGTMAYLALWGFFPRADAAALLSLLMFLKLVVVVTLLLAHQRFLQNKGLVLLLLTSLVCNVIVAFLHGLVPIPLVSIADDIAAIVLCIVAIIWALVLLVGSIPAIVKAVRSTLSTARDVRPPAQL
jgi:hypothetical protein